MTSQERMEAEKLARRIEWLLNDQPSLSEDDHLSPEAARQGIDALIAEYPWLTEWCALVEAAAKAKAVLDVSKSAGVPRLVENRLGQTYAEAMTPLSNFHPTGDDPYNVIRTFAALKHLASKHPPGYEDS